MAVDWLAIRNDYINGGGSYRKLADKYGVNKDTIAFRAKSEGWKEQRDIQTDKTHTKTIQKTEEKISDALSDEAALKVRARSGLLRLAVDWIEKQTEIEDIGGFRKMVQACAEMGVMDTQDGEAVEDDGLLAALGANAGDLFDDGDDSEMLPKEKDE